MKSRLLKNSFFRLALIYLTLFAVSVLLLFAFIYWASAGYMVRQTAATIQAETNGLVEHYQQDGINSLYSVIKERLARKGANPEIYLLTDRQFKPLLGNLEQWPQQPVSEEGWVSFQLNKNEQKGEGYRALARVFLLQNRYYLLVGQDIHQLQQMQDLLREALLWGLLLTLVLGAGGGLMISKTLMRKIEAINNSCHQIMAGDLTHRIPYGNSNDDFDKLIATLNTMLDQIEELMQGVKQVSDNIAHDLRTPLSRLRRRLDQLRLEQNSAAQAEELLEQAISEADGLLTSFTALLRISEIEAGSRRGHFTAVNIAELMTDLVELYEPVAQEKKLQIHWQKPVLKSIQGDPDLLFQALANLLDNAIKYSPDGGVIWLTAKTNNASVQLNIGDNGPGIAPELRSKVVERFYRLEKHRSSPGNGLGLSLVAAIVKLHNGRMELMDNHPGLNIQIELP